ATFVGVFISRGNFLRLSIFELLTPFYILVMSPGLTQSAIEYTLKSFDYFIIFKSPVLCNFYRFYPSNNFVKLFIYLLSALFPLRRVHDHPILVLAHSRIEFLPYL